jgi:putative hydrolase
MKRKVKFFDLMYLKENGIPDIDYHSHTHFTDAVGTVAEYAKVAKEKEISCFAITDHIWRSSRWLNNLLEEIDETRRQVNIQILSGVEAKQISIYGDIDVRNMDARNVDIVLGSVHAYPTEKDYVFLNPNDISIKKALEIETEAMIALAENGQVDIIAHPYILYKKYFNRGTIPMEHAMKVITAAIDNDIALEVNNKYKVPDKEFLETILKCGAKISIGSDAHKPEDIGNIPRDLIKNAIGALE